jgi:hypothetical protein
MLYSRNRLGSLENLMRREAAMRFTGRAHGTMARMALVSDMPRFAALPAARRPVEVRVGGEIYTTKKRARVNGLGADGRARPWHHRPAALIFLTNPKTRGPGGSHPATAKEL